MFGCAAMRDPLDVRVDIRIDATHRETMRPTPIANFAPPVDGVGPVE